MYIDINSSARAHQGTYMCMQISLIPALNKDCVALIISLLDRSSLRNVAGTSKAGSAAALPTLFHTVTLRIKYPGDILKFSKSVLRNRLAQCIRHLTLLTSEWTMPAMPESELRDALSSLANVIASAESLASLRICPSAQSLFDEAPAVLDSILLHPPSHSLELANIADVDWLVKHQLTGLRNFSLGFTHWRSDILDLFAITAGSATTLEMIHLCLSGTLDPIKFAEGFMPYSKLRMLSIARLTSSDMAFPDFHLADLCKAFPNIQFICFCSSNTLTSVPMLSASMHLKNLYVLYSSIHPT
ncbi:hypothetical protein EWM64_g3921 [Hericium alpestre]|uniref:F-box domain-containing protein n=1 Tax=Hericium alpestre TaxID=135208 RepID=A0A4Z0A0X7_9AGAM|nr:hypothetical protein EWM64_g3921 [Hericium alpestre]